MAARDLITGRTSEQTRFWLMALPGVLFVMLFLVVPILSIVVFSFWRTESYDLIADWNFENYRVLLTTPTYMTFLWRSFSMAVIVSLVCMVLGWPIAYYIARYGGRYRLLMVLALAAPFFTGVILRVTAIQSIMGPVGAIGLAMTFIPVLAEAIAPIFLGGPSGASYGSVLSRQFSESGTWALGSAMGVLLFLLSFAVIAVIWFSVDLRRSGYTGKGAK
jgi:ABC-type spermidine/putrescine transport system permease subunit I